MPAPDLQSETKAELRRIVRERIAAMGQGERRRADAAVCACLQAEFSVGRCDWVLGYLALRDEVRIDEGLAAFVAAGLRVYLPRLTADGLRAGVWVPTTRLHRDAAGVLAPREAGIEGLPRGRGLVLVPGRAFDRIGRRLGRGGGWYDRLLERAGPETSTVGVAYDCQLFDRVPSQTHDRRVSGIVSEDGLEIAGTGTSEFEGGPGPSGGSETEDDE